MGYPRDLAWHVFVCFIPFHLPWPLTIEFRSSWFWDKHFAKSSSPPPANGQQCYLQWVMYTYSLEDFLESQVLKKIQLCWESQDCIWITRVSISKVSAKPHLIRLFHNFFSYSDAIDSSLISSLDLPICVFNVFSFIVPSAYREGELGRTAKHCLLLSWAMVNVFVLKFLWFYISFQ